MVLAVDGFLYVFKGPAVRAAAPFVRMDRTARGASHRARPRARGRRCELESRRPRDSVLAARRWSRSSEAPNDAKTDTAGVRAPTASLRDGASATLDLHGAGLELLRLGGAGRGGVALACAPWV